MNDQASLVVLKLEEMLVSFMLMWNWHGCLHSFRSLIIYFKFVRVKLITHNIAVSTFYYHEKRKDVIFIRLVAKLREMTVFHVLFYFFSHHNDSRSYC